MERRLENRSGLMDCSELERRREFNLICNNPKKVQGLVEILRGLYGLNVLLQCDPSFYLICSIPVIGLTLSTHYELLIFKDDFRKLVSTFNTNLDISTFYGGLYLVLC